MKRNLAPLCVLIIIGFSLSNAQEKNVSANARHLSPQDQKLVDVEKMLWEAWKSKDRKPYEDALSG